MPLRQPVRQARGFRGAETFDAAEMLTGSGYQLPPH
jgi:hypothetical protein